MVHRMDLIADLNARGLVHDATDQDALAKRLVDGPIGVYVGFDPTADSLHVGHLFGQLSLRRFQLAGHRPFPLAGGATGMIGDPSGRSDERNLLDRDTLRANVAAIKVQLERLLDFSPGPFAATLVDNADWTEPLATLEFLRDVGKHVTVNQMLAKESVRARVESDPRHLLHRVQLHAPAGQRLPVAVRAPRRRAPDGRLGPVGQHHGRDRPHPPRARPLGPRAHLAPAHPGRRRQDGQDRWAERSGSTPTRPARTSSASSGSRPTTTWSTATCRHLSLRPLDEIEALLEAHAAAPERRLAQRALADELTPLVHGPEAAAAAADGRRVLFGGDPDRLVG